jgi:adenylate cyclase
MRYVFEGFALDAARRELRRGSEPVALEPQVFDLLVHLIRRRDAVVGKDELITEIWKGRSVSDSALDARISAARLAVRDSGAEQRLIKTFPRRGVRFVGTVIEEAFGARDAPIGPPLPDRPSLAVLPFANMSSDPEQDYFADGIVDDITTGLARIHWLFVIARNSSFTYKGRAIDVRQVGRELGVRYVLEGGVRKFGERLRITVQLVEAETGVHLWAEKYDGALAEVFDLQDRITDSVVGVLEPSLRRREIERCRRKRPESLDAYDLYLRALPHMSSAMPDGSRLAVDELERALKLEPNYAAAHALLAWRHEICFVRQPGFSEVERAAGLHHARAAIANAADDATALAISAFVIAHLARDYAGAILLIERALSLNASCAAAFYFGAHIHSFGGDDMLAVSYAQRALRLSPFDPLAYAAHQALGMAAVEASRYDEAAVNLAKSAQANPRFAATYLLLAFVLALAGREKEAIRAAERGMELWPSYQTRVISVLGIKPGVAVKLEEGARRLGLPE